MKYFKIISFFVVFLSFAGMSFAANETVLGKYGAITIKKVLPEAKRGDTKSDEGVVVAYIDDDSKEAPDIPTDIQVDSVYYSRVFKASVPSTIMLPFEVRTWRLGGGFSIFEYVDVVKDCETCPFRVNVRTKYLDTLKANTPYIALSEGKDNVISLGSSNGASGVVLNTSVNRKTYSFSESGLDWTIIGTYEFIEFRNPAGVYGFAAKNKNDVKMGDFKKAACNDTSCAYIKPFRAYLKCSVQNNASKVRALAKSANISLEDLPESIEVRVLSDSGTTYLGHMDTRTGEITVKDNRWFDMKGRVLQHKPTAKGTYYNNRKKVIIK